MRAVDTIKYPKLSKLERNDEERQFDAAQQFRLNRNFKTIQDAIIEAEEAIAALPEKILADVPIPSDYIVARGESSSWQYEKYASGKCVAWRETLAMTKNVNTAAGNLYYVTESISLPSGLFSAVETAVVSLRTTSHGYAATLQSVSTSAIGIEIIGGASASISCYADILVRGTYT